MPSSIGSQENSLELWLQLSHPSLTLMANFDVETPLGSFLQPRLLLLDPFHAGFRPLRRLSCPSRVCSGVSTLCWLLGRCHHHKRSATVTIPLLAGAGDCYPPPPSLRRHHYPTTPLLMMSSRAWMSHSRPLQTLHQVGVGQYALPFTPLDWQEWSRTTVYSLSSFKILFNLTSWFKPYLHLDTSGGGTGTSNPVKRWALKLDVHIQVN